MPKVSRIWAREILDSRSTPTVEAICQLDNGVTSVISIPSGASIGSHEAIELRDGDEARFHGKGVLNAVRNINEIISPQLKLSGIEVTEQDKIDQKLIQLDGTENKSKLGANAILAASASITKAAAATQQISLYSWINKLAVAKGIEAHIHVPVPAFNMINGGLHGAGNLDFQEFFVIPASSKSYADGLRMGSEIYVSIGTNLKTRGAIHSVGDEGGYAPNLFTNADAFEILTEAIRQSNYQIGRDVFLGLDVAADTFYKDNTYSIRDKSAPLSEDALIDYYKELNSSYHFAILEDGIAEDSWQGWQKLTQALGSQTAVMGDDLLATNMDRVRKAIANQSCNAAIIKPNQIGTISETLDVIKLVRSANWKFCVSHRSGETNDVFIADFAVGVGADYLKFGAPSRGERVGKYNRLSAIDLELKYTEQNSNGPQQK